MMSTPSSTANAVAACTSPTRNTLRLRRLSSVHKLKAAAPCQPHYIDPGSPWQNAYNESFNSIFRTTCLNRWLFCSMTETRVVTDHWLDEYNTVRPHGSLGGMTPEQFLK